MDLDEAEDESDLLQSQDAFYHHSKYRLKNCKTCWKWQQKATATHTPAQAVRWVFKIPAKLLGHLGCGGGLGEAGESQSLWCGEVRGFFPLLYLPLAVLTFRLKTTLSSAHLPDGNC